MIKIQKAMTYPKAADMMQLLDANTEEYLPLKIIVCENKVGKIEFFAEEMKKENGIGFLARGQEEAADIFRQYFQKKINCSVYLVSYETGRNVIFHAELEYETCEAELLQVDASVFEDMCQQIIGLGIAGRKELERNIRVMKEHRFPDELIRQILSRYRKYDRPIHIPKTIYIDPDKESKTSLLALCAINILIGSPLILEGDKSVGKNVCAETLAMIFHMPFDMITMTRSMTADDLYGTKSTDNTAAEKLTVAMASEYLKYQMGQEDADIHAASEFEYLKAKSSSVSIVQEHASFVHWLQHGGVYCLNEMNMAEANFLASFANQITDGSGFIDIQGYGRIQIHPDCVLIGTQNSNYTGTCEQNDATMSRFACIAFDYPASIRPMLEAVVGKKRLAGQYFAQVDAYYSLLRESVQQGTLENSCLNIRGFCRALNAVALIPGASTLRKQIELHVINTYPLDERMMLEQLLNQKITL